MGFPRYFCAVAKWTTCLLGLILGLPVMAQSDDFSTYTRHAHGWTIEYPSDWDVSATDPNYVEFSQPEENALCGVHSGNTRWTSIDDVWEFLLTQDGKQVRPDGPINHIVDHERIEARPEVVGIRVNAELVPGGAALSSYFVYSGNFIAIDCETYTSNWPRVAPDYQAILDSVSFEKTQAAIAYDEGVAAFQKRNESKAFEYFLKAAEDGDARAQYSVGIMLHQGRGTKVNLTEAMNWLRRSAEHGQLGAQVAFWQIRFRAGALMEPELVEALVWLRAAAENGHVDSQFQLAMHLRYGGSTIVHDGRTYEMNAEEALKWFLEVARQGHARAQHEAGAILLNKSWKMFDARAAYGWLSIAVENGHQAAAELKESAVSSLSPAERRAIDGEVKRCLATQYSECGL